MANSGLVIVSLLMIVCDSSKAANQRNARILRRETLPDGTIQVTVPFEDAVKINGVLSAVVPTYQCVRTVQNGLYRQQLTYPCKPRVIIANQSAGLVASTRAPVKPRSLPDSISTVSLSPRVGTKSQTDQDIVIGTTTTAPTNNSKTKSKREKENHSPNSTDTILDDTDSAAVLTSSFAANNSTKPRGCRFSCRHSTASTATATTTTTTAPSSYLPTVAVPIASQASSASNSPTSASTQPNGGTSPVTASQPAKETGSGTPFWVFSGNRTTCANAKKKFKFGRATESPTSSSAPSFSFGVNPTQISGTGVESKNSSLRYFRPRNCSQASGPSSVSGSGTSNAVL